MGVGSLATMLLAAETRARPSAIYLQLQSGAARAARPSVVTSWQPDWSIRTRKVVRPECLRTSANKVYFLQQSQSLQPVATMDAVSCAAEDWRGPLLTDRGQ